MSNVAVLRSERADVGKARDYLGPAEVAQVSPAEILVRLPGGNLVPARPAMAFTYEPAAGDVVLVIGNADGHYWTVRQVFQHSPGPSGDPPAHLHAGDASTPGPSGDPPAHLHAGDASTGAPKVLAQTCSSGAPAPRGVSSASCTLCAAMPSGCSTTSGTPSSRRSSSPSAGSPCSLGARGSSSKRIVTASSGPHGCRRSAVR